MAKKEKIKKLNKPRYVTDEWGHDDAAIVRKVNELVEIVNHLQKENDDLKAMIQGGRKWR